MTTPAHFGQVPTASAAPAAVAPSSSTSPGCPPLQAEAARYALLRRLAPSMRHHLVVNLQPIGMIYEVLDRRLRASEPNLSEVHDSAQKINGFARAALNSSLDVVTWLAPDEDAAVTVVDCVNECLALVATSFSFRGYALRNEVASVEGQVRKSAMRCVLTGALIHLSDEHPAPAQIRLSAEGGEHGLVLTISLQSTEGEQGFSTAPSYRALTWGDLQALAEAEGVLLDHAGSDVLRVTLPWAAARAAD